MSSNQRPDLKTNFALFAVALLIHSMQVSAELAIGCGTTTQACPSSGGQSKPCCPIMTMPYGTFYGYCHAASSQCAAADGLNGRLTENEWCKTILDSNGNPQGLYTYYSGEDPYWLDGATPTPGAKPGPDVLGWDLAALQAAGAQTDKHVCDLLYPQSVVSPIPDRFTYTYDAKGNVIAAADPLKQISRSFYSHRNGNLPYSTWASDNGYALNDKHGYSTIYYDGLGQPIINSMYGGEIDSRSQYFVTINAFDGFNRIIETKGYCLEDTYSVVSKGPSEVVKYFYDKTSTGSPCGLSKGKLCEIQTFSYKCGGLLGTDGYKEKRFLNSQTSTSFTYGDSSRGRLTSETKRIGFYSGNAGDSSRQLIEKTYDFSYTYDSANNVRSIQYPGGTTINYNVNSLNQIDTATIGGVRPSQPVNLVTNPGFEDGANGWIIDTGHLVTNSPNALSGKSYVESGFWTPSQLIPINQFEVGANYELSLYAKNIGTDSGTDPTYLEVSVEQATVVGSSVTWHDDSTNENGFLILRCVHHPPLQSGWTKYTCTSNQYGDGILKKKIPGATHIGVLGYTRNTGYRILLDEISLTKVVVNPPMVDSVTSFEYNPTGTISKKNSDNLLFTNYQYDALDRMFSTQTSRVGFENGDALYERAYQFDKVGNIKKIGYDYKTAVPSDSQWNSEPYKDTFVYDNLDRLTSAIYSDGSTSETFQYDLVGNRINFNGLPYLYDNGATGGQATRSNRIKTISGWQFGYDSRGNIIFMSKPGMNSMSFTYDAFNRLSKLAYRKNPTDSDSTEYYFYDQNGKRVIKKTQRDNAFYVYSGNDVVLDEGCIFTPGDADGNSLVTISDAVYLINYIFAGGPKPTPELAGDADGTGQISISDAVYAINFIFAGGLSPTSICEKGVDKSGPLNKIGLSIPKINDELQVMIPQGTSVPLTGLQAEFTHPANYLAQATLSSAAASQGFQIHSRTFIDESGQARTRIGILNGGGKSYLPISQSLASVKFTSPTGVNLDLVNYDLENSITVDSNAKEFGVFVSGLENMPSPTPNASAIPTSSINLTISTTPNPSPSPTPAINQTVSPTPMPSPTVIASSPTPTTSPTPTPTVLISPSPTATILPSPSVNATISPTPSPSATKPPKKIV